MKGTGAKPRQVKLAQLFQGVSYLPDGLIARKTEIRRQRSNGSTVVAGMSARGRWGRKGAKTCYKGSPQAKRATLRGGNPSKQGSRSHGH